MSGGRMRDVMPDTASIVDDLRAALGHGLVDAAIAAGQRASREYATRRADGGEARADAWLAAERFPQGCFWAKEGGIEAGVRRR